MNVNHVAAASYGVARIDVVHLASQMVLRCRYICEIPRIPGVQRTTTVHHVDGDVTPRHVIAKIPPGALGGGRVAGQRRLQIADLGRGQQSRRKMLGIVNHRLGATGKVNILRFDPLRTDRIGGVLSRAGRLRESARQHVPHIDRLDIVARQIDIEIEHRHAQIAPNRDVGQDRGRDIDVQARRSSVDSNGVQAAAFVDRKNRVPSIGVAEIHLEVRHEER